ncbi:MAG: type II secretion system protein [Candidatus Wildermuthbacteria bacterium]|nr:type II secretion system protein [Candidatus Wildermuthbacteria bacterium]
MQKSKCKINGFTLVELLVSVAVFSVVIGIALEVFVSSVRIQRRVLANQEIQDQTSYLMEYFSRAIRMARKDVDGSCVPAGLNYQKNFSRPGIRFKNYEGVCQEFYLDADSRRLKEERGGINSFLTSASLHVSSFNIGADDSWDSGDNDQPKVAFFLKITGKDQSRIKIQTTVSQRNPDM